MNILEVVKDKFNSFDFKSQKEISFKGEVGEIPFSAYLYIKPNSDKLFVLFNGALDDKHTKGAPIYQRWSWHKDFPGSVMYITDPTLLKYTDINLSWYIGDKNNKVDLEISSFVKEVADNIGTRRIISYGSSGGGFAALQLACNIEADCIAVAINPQTRVFEYVKEFVNKYLDSCWEGVEKNNLINDLSFNAIENYKINRPNVIYIQNTVDVFHYKKHFLPFLSELKIDTDLISKPLSEQEGTVKVLLYTHDSGHAAEPRELLPEIFQAIESL